MIGWEHWRGLGVEHHIKEVQNILNTRPRERIGFIRPAHAMVTHLMAA